MFRILHFKNLFQSILLGAFILLCGILQAQNQAPSDTLRSTLTDTDEIAIYKETPHNPRKATLMSAFLPGLGQAYNKKYWKIPFIYGGGLALYSSYSWNNTYYQAYKSARESLLNGEEITIPELVGVEEDDLKLKQSYYRKYRDLSLIGLGILYFANVVDAMVDGYLFEYDISDDLTLHVEPTILMPDYNSLVATSSPGFKLSFRF